MAELPKLTYTKSWEDPVDFPTVETSEAQVRGDLQRLFSETRDYLNQKLVPAVEEAIREGGEGTGSAPGSGASQGDGVDLSGYLRKEGGTMTGPLLLSRQPQSDMEAATRKYAASAAEDVRSALGQRASELGRGVEDLTARVTDLEENGSRELRETVTALSGRRETSLPSGRVRKPSLPRWRASKGMLPPSGRRRRGFPPRCMPRRGTCPSSSRPPTD